MNCKCMCCDKELEVDKHTDDNAVFFPIIYGGVVFRSTGQYGSSTIDFFSEKKEIQIIICDRCILEKHDKIDVVKNFKTTATAEYGDFTEVFSKEEREKTLKDLLKNEKNKSG